MDAALAIDDREFVRVVVTAGTHQRLHQLRLALHARGRDHDRAAPPAHDAGMDEEPVGRCDRDVEPDRRFEQLEGVGCFDDLDTCPSG